MSDSVTGHVPGPAVNSDHVRHDLLLVARFAAGDSDEPERRAAQELVDHCSECAALATDLQLVEASMRHLPQPARTRDFRLSEAQARRLRGGVLQRLVHTLGGPRLTLARPLASAAMALGITLAVIGGTMGSFAPGLASAPVFDQATSVPGAAAAPAATAAPSPAPAASVESPPSADVAITSPSSRANTPGTVMPASAPTGSAKASGSSAHPGDYNETASAPPPPASGSSGGEGGEQSDGQTSPAASDDATGYLAPGSAQGQPPAPPVSESATSGSRGGTLSGLLLLGGSALAVVGLLLLLAVTYARRRFA